MSSAPQLTGRRKLVSQLLLSDIGLRGTVEEFVKSLPRRLEELRQAYQLREWDRLTALAHRLKGAAGSYGYPDISRLCADLEPKLRARQADDFAAFLAKLVALTQAAQAGLTDPA